MKKKTYSLSDIVDLLLTFGGFGFTLFILSIWIPSLLSVPLVPLKGVLVLLASFGIGSLGASRLLIRKKSKNKLIEDSSTKRSKMQLNQVNYAEDLEIRFLEALTLQKGRITLTEAVVLIRESVDKLLPIIRKLQLQGVVGTEVDDKGQIFYVNS